MQGPTLGDPGPALPAISYFSTSEHWLEISLKHEPMDQEANVKCVP